MVSACWDFGPVFGIRRHGLRGAGPGWSGGRGGNTFCNSTGTWKDTFCRTTGTLENGILQFLRVRKSRGDKPCTPGSMNSLFTDQNLADFWPGFLALDQTARGRLGVVSRGAGGGNTVLQFYRHREIPCRALLGHRNTVLHDYFHSLFSFQNLKT